MRNLPADICLVLFDLVEPLDILSIGQTCRILREFSSIRFVWTRALRRVVEANSLFEPVFNYEDESVPLRHLQHAVTSPRRMLALLDRNQKIPEEDREMDPFSMTTIHFLDPDMCVMGSRRRKVQVVQETLLVPGGRFVLVLSTSFSRLTVIDVERYLHLKSKGEENPSLADYTASAHCQCTHGLFRANISLDGHTLLIIHFQSQPDGVDTFTLWKYDPASNLLSLEKSVDIETDRQGTCIETHYMSSNLFIFKADATLFIWDFLNDKYARWVVSYPRYYGSSRTQIFTDGSRIFLLAIAQIQIWDIPSLVFGPLVNNQAHLIQCPPTLSFPSADSRIPASIKKNVGQIIPLDDWYSGPKHPLLFDILTWRSLNGNHNSRMERTLVRQQFNISHLAEGQDTSTPNNARTPITYTQLQGLGVNDVVNILPSMMCEDRIISIACSDQAGSFFVMSTPGYIKDPPLTEPNEVFPNELVSLGYYQPQCALQHYKFDPCSGRLLQVSTDGSSIVISDYLRTPHLMDSES